MYNSNTKFIFSISSNPSSRGSKFYNTLFKKLKLNLIYIPIKITSTIEFNKFFLFLNKRILNFKGCSISMPFKHNAYLLCDLKHISAKQSKNVNTIISVGKKLKGFNTDYMAVKTIMSRYEKKKYTILILGAGGLAKSFIAFLNSFKNINMIVVNRNLNRKNQIRQICKKCLLKKLNDIISFKPDIVINTIPIISNNKIFNDINLNNTKVVIDCIISYKMTYLSSIAKKKSIKLIDGRNFYDIQQKFQKELYI